MIKYISIILFCISNLCYSQAQLEWISKFKQDSSNSTISDVTTDKNGNIFVTGSTGRDNIGKMFFLKYSPTGNLIWKQFFKRDTSSALNTWSSKITVDDEGNIYICGSSQLSQSSGALMLIKYKPSGDTAWVRYHSFNSGGHAIQIIVDKFKNIYLCGYPMITKFDKAGNFLWHVLPPSGIDLKGMALDRNQNVYILARKETFYTEFLTLKYNSAGEFEWSRSYTRGPDCYPYSIACDQHSNVYVAGEVQNLPNGFSTTTLIKYNPLGDTVYIKDFSSAVGTTLFMHNDTINYLAGLWPVRFNVNGDVYWRDSTQFNVTKMHSLDNKGNLYSWHTPRTNNIQNVHFNKYSLNGQIMWEKKTTFTDTSNLRMSALHLDKDNNILLPFTLSPVGVNYLDTLMIYKYSQTVSVNPIGIEIIKDYYISQNYPNPFNPSTNFKFSIPKSGFVTIKVYDVLGKEINTLVNQFKSAGSYIVPFDATSLSSGVYFYTFESGNYRFINKMLLIK